MQFRTRPFRAFLFALLLFVFWDRHQKCLKCFPAVYSLSKMANLQPPKLREKLQAKARNAISHCWVAWSIFASQNYKHLNRKLLSWTSRFEGNRAWNALKTAKKLTSSGDKKPWCKDLSFHFLDACVSRFWTLLTNAGRTISVLKWVRVCMVPTYVWSSNPFQYFQGYLYNRYTVI